MARFLTEEEREVARARGVRQSGEATRAIGINWKELGLTLLDVKAWLTAVSTIPRRPKFIFQRH